MSTYITASDISDTIASGFNLSSPYDYLTETDNEVNDLAEQLGVSTDSISTPLHYKIKRYAIVFCVMRLCQDKMGKNNPDLPEIEKYKIKYDQYAKELTQLRQEITYEMYTGEVDEIRDRAAVSGTLYRG